MIFEIARGFGHVTLNFHHRQKFHPARISKSFIFNRWNSFHASTLSWDWILDLRTTIYTNIRWSFETLSFCHRRILSDLFSLLRKRLLDVVIGYLWPCSTYPGIGSLLTSDVRPYIRLAVCTMYSTTCSVLYHTGWYYRTVSALCSTACAVGKYFRFSPSHLSGITKLCFQHLYKYCMVWRVWR